MTSPITRPLPLFRAGPGWGLSCNRPTLVTPFYTISTAYAIRGARRPEGLVLAVVTLTRTVQHTFYFSALGPAQPQARVAPG